MTRRSAYLLAWGIAFSALGLFSVEGGSPLLGVWLALAGVFSILGAVIPHKWADNLGFTSLALVSAGRATFFLIEFVESVSTALLMGLIVWGSVAVAQVIVAGWPDSKLVSK